MRNTGMFRSAKTMLKRLVVERKGQSMIMMAAAIPVLLGMSLGFIEFNEVRYVKSVIQNALDSGALAGAATQASVITGYTWNGQWTAPQTCSLADGDPASAVNNPNAKCKHKILVPNYDRQIWNGQGGATSSLPVAPIQARDVFFNFLNQSGILNNKDISTSSMSVSYTVVGTNEVDGTISFPIHVPILQTAMRLMNGGHAGSQLTVNLKTTAKMQ